MSYIKTVWQDGDVITAEKLNKIENGIDGIDLGYARPETTITLFDDEITLGQYYDEGGFFYDSFEFLEDIAFLLLSSLHITFNGVEYVCEKIETEGSIGFGNRDPLSSEYSFSLGIMGNKSFDFISTEAGPHSLKVVFTGPVVTVSEDFYEAVRRVVYELENSEGERQEF